jgi:hypothetical protein
MVLMMARRKANPCEQRLNSRATSSQVKAKGNYQARVHSVEMVLIVVRREAGLVAWWQKMPN